MIRLSEVLWNDLHDLSVSVDLPWLLQGDFNPVLSNTDRMVGNPIDEVVVSDFQDWLINIDLQEIKTSRPTFIWSNNKAGVDRIYRKLAYNFGSDC